MSKNQLAIIEDGIKSFDEMKQAISSEVVKTKELKFTSIEDKELIKQIPESRKALKKLRNSIENKAKELRDSIRPFIDNIRDKELELVAIIKPEEERLQGIEKQIESEKLRIAEEKKRERELFISSRIQKLFEVGYAFNGEYYSINDKLLNGLQIIINQIKEVAEKGATTEVVFMNPLPIHYQTFLIELGYTVENGEAATVVRWYDKPLTQSELEEIHKPVIVVSEIKQDFPL